MTRVVRYNWPRYATTAAVLVAALATPIPAVRAGAAVACGWLALGLAATRWVYDRSPLYRWRWCTDLLPAPPGRYAVISTGLDEISGALARRYPRAEATVVDLYDPRVTPERSIRRARALVPPPPHARAGRVDDLPVPTGSQDAVFMAFAAHELRTGAQRRAVFGEVARVLRRGGHLVLVEHCRDLANVAAYGPGAWHFYPRGEWLRRAEGAGLRRVAEARMTPLVRALVLRR